MKTNQCDQSRRRIYGGNQVLFVYLYPGWSFVRRRHLRLPRHWLQKRGASRKRKVPVPRVFKIVHCLYLGQYYIFKPSLIIPRVDKQKHITCYNQILIRHFISVVSPTIFETLIRRFRCFWNHSIRRIAKDWNN